MGLFSKEPDLDENLYPPGLVLSLDFSKSPAKFNPPISAANPGEEWMVVRPLQRRDYDKGFLKLLSQLTSVGNISLSQFNGEYHIVPFLFHRISKKDRDNNEPDLDENLYPPGLVLSLDFSKSPAKFNPPISAANPGEEWMVVRPLQRRDYDKGFLKLLSQLTSVGNISLSQFNECFTRMKKSGSYYVTVIEDRRHNKIIGAATLNVEQKFIHNCALRGHLEDVVVDDTYRGKQLGKLIVVTVSLLAQELGCYKMTLECKDKLIKYYESLGYVLEPGNSNSMNIRYDRPS